MRRFVLCFIFYLSVSQLGAQTMADLITTFEEDEDALNRKYIVRESDEYYKRFTDFYNGWKTSLAGVKDENKSREELIDWYLLDNLLDKRIYFLLKSFRQYNHVRNVTDFAAPLYEFMANRRRGNKVDAQRIAGIMNEAVLAVKSKQHDMEASPYAERLDALKAADIIESLREGLDEANKFYNGYDPMYSWWMKTTYASLDTELKTFKEFLEKHISPEGFVDDGSGIRGRPIGEEAIVKSLEFEFISYSPQQLIEAAWKQYAWCEDEMKKASRELGFGDAWLKALEFVKDTYVPPGEQPAMIERLAEEAIEFLEANDMITIPPLAKETWRMRMMSPQRQLVNPFFTGGEAITISYPTETMGYEDKMMSMRGNNPNFSWPTVQHELIPGHHLQQFMSRRYKTYRRSFSTPFWTEGWALYWEIILWNKGFHSSPEQRVGMLFWRMHRCARIIFSLSYHMGKMTPQECIDLLVTKVGHEPANAIAEVRRSFESSYDPLYQIAYMIGGLEFFALRNEQVPGSMTEKQYHDWVMQQGRVPVAALRALLNEQEIKTKKDIMWKFSTDFNLKSQHD